MGFGKILGWLALFVVGSLIVSAIINPESLDPLKNKFSNFAGSVISGVKSNEIQDSLISDALFSFNKCKNIFSRKYGGSIILLEKEKISDEESAKEFYKTWGGFGQYATFDSTFDLYPWGDKSFSDYTPLVLMATRIDGDYDSSPYVLGYSNGELIGEGGFC